MNGSRDHLAAVLARIESTGLSANDYNVLGILDDILRDGVTVTDVNDQEFLYLLTHHVREQETSLPCPPWCSRNARHPFESESHDGIQSRAHEAKLPQPSFPNREPFELYLSLLQEDERVRGDDTKARQLPAALSLAVDAEFQAAELRKLAGALLDAADKLDEVNGAQGWTEDRL